MVEVCAAALFTTGAAMVWTTAAVSVDAVTTTESVLEAAFWINAVSAAEVDEDVVSTGTIEVSATGAEETEEVRVSTTALSTADEEVVSTGTTGVAEAEEVVVSAGTTVDSTVETEEDVVSTGATGVGETKEVRVSTTALSAAGAEDVVSTGTTATGVEDTTATAVDDEATVGSAEG